MNHSSHREHGIVERGGGTRAASLLSEWAVENTSHGFLTAQDPLLDGQLC